MDFYCRSAEASNCITGHIVLADSHSKVRSNDHLREYMKEISSDGKTVTCYIVAETGRFFTGTWWCNDKNPVTVQPYTAEFVRDGESVCFYGFDRKAAASVRGIGAEWVHERDEDDSSEDEADEEERRYYFMFRSMEVSGEDSYATTIPAAVGTLEIILRRVTDDALERDFGGGDNGTEDESDTEGEDFESSTDDSEDEMYEESPSRIKKAKLAPDDLHDTFTDWCEKKPRHTHTAAMTRSDGTLWQDRPRCHVPKLPKPLDSNEDDIIVKFIFIYTAKEYIMKLKKEPRSASPPSFPRRQISDPNNEGQPAKKRRRTESARYIKTEDEQKVYDEMLALQERVDGLRRVLEKSKRARGEAVEGDRNNPIEVVEDDASMMDRGYLDS